MYAITYTLPRSKQTKRVCLGMDEEQSELCGLVVPSWGQVASEELGCPKKGHDEQLNQAVNATESIYRTVISEHLPRILESIDISKIVRERINEMDVKETEKLIRVVGSLARSDYGKPEHPLSTQV